MLLNRISCRLGNFQLGANAVEYALVMAIVVTMILSASQFLNTPISAMFTQAGQKMAAMVNGGATTSQATNSASSTTSVATTTTGTTTTAANQTGGSTHSQTDYPNFEPGLGQGVEQITFENSQWKSSHNSYQRNETILEQWRDWGLHSFELDIHAGDPVIQIGSADNRPDNDWYVYHANLDQDTHYTYLSDGLDDIVAINNAAPDHEPITLFIDLKNDPLAQDGQSRDDLDRLLQEKLGDSLYTPGDFVERADGATSLHGALDQEGWPTVDELQGKVIVVLTGGSADGQLGDYTGENASDRVAFIAPNASVKSQLYDLGNGEADIGAPAFYADDNAVFYNMKGDDVGHAGLVTEQDFSLRVWDLNNEASFVAAQQAGANYLGTNKVNTDRDDWSTSNEAGSPFTPLEERAEEGEEESGPL